MRRKYVEIHNFFCLNCGGKIPLARKRGKEKFHRKKLYCPYCQNVVNHAECRTEYEETEFVEAFNKGMFCEEAKESLEYNAAHPLLFDIIRDWDLNARSYV